MAKEVLFDTLVEDIFQCTADAMVIPTGPYRKGKKHFQGAIERELFRQNGMDAYEKMLYEWKTALPSDVFVLRDHALKEKYSYLIFVNVQNVEKHFAYSHITRCYEKVLEKAKELGIKSINFPLIGAGGFGMDYVQAFDLAQTAITGFMRCGNYKIHVTLCVQEQVFERMYSYADKSMLQRGLKGLKWEYEATQEKVRELQKALEEQGGDERFFEYHFEQLYYQQCLKEELRQNIVLREEYEAYEKELRKFDVEKLFENKKALHKINISEGCAIAGISRNAIYRILNREYDTARDILLIAAFIFRLTRAETNMLLASRGHAYLLEYAKEYERDRIIEKYLKYQYHNLKKCNLELMENKLRPLEKASTDSPEDYTKREKKKEYIK